MGFRPFLFFCPGYTLWIGRMRRIGVPTDFSDCAGLASELALHLAKKSKAELLYLHLEIDPSSPPHVPGEPATLVDHEIGRAKYKLSQLVKRAESFGTSAKSELILDSGEGNIQDYIEPFGIDWLVMGSHGVKGIREALIGSKTQHVVQHVSVPTLVVKQLTPNFKLKNIVFASTFKEDATHALQVVTTFCELFNANLHLLFVNMISHLVDEKMSRLTMKNAMKEFNSIPFTVNITYTNDEEFGIDQFAKSIDADMIAVAMERQSTLGRLLSPALALQLINHSELPVLVVNPA